MKELNKTKINFMYFVTIVLTLLLSSCDLEDHLQDVNVYVAGGYQLGDDYYTCYWVNGQRTLLYNHHSVPDIFANGEDFYVAASTRLERSYGGRAAYWVNGIENVLVNQWSSTRQVIVENDKIYILGYTFDQTNGRTELKHWLYRDGAFTELEGFVMAMHIEGEDIYLAGMRSEFDRTPTYWINGAAHNCETNGYDLGPMIVKDVDVKEGTVYMVGHYRNNELRENRACLWKNGKMIDIEKVDSEAYAIHIDDNDIYIAGYKKASACYWKNGKHVNLGKNPSGWSRAHDITVYNGDVYVTGSNYGSKDGVFVWKNSKDLFLELEIPWAVNRSGYAYSISVVGK